MRSYTIIFVLLTALLTPRLYSQTANVTQGCFPFEVEFSPPTGMSSYFWDFGNGATSTLENPSANFTSAGVFNVELYNQPGGTWVGTLQITSYAPPEIEVFASPDFGCAPLEVTFSYNAVLPQGVSVIEHQWVFGDGGSVITASPTATYTFQNGGNYSASLELVTTAPSCNVTQVFADVVEVEQEPDLQILTSLDPPQSCNVPFDITFSPSWTGGTSYSWDFGNGNTSNLQNPPTQTYGEGNFDVTLSATSPSGCVYTTEIQVSGGSPEATINMPDTLCINTPFSIENNNSPLFYIWNFGPNATPQFVSGASPTVTFDQEGWETVILTVTSLDQFCSAEFTKDIYIEEAIADFTTEPSFACANTLLVTASATATNAAEYNWSFSPAGWATPPMSTGQTTTVEFLDSSEFYPYSETPFNIFHTSLEVITPAGCVATADNTSDPDTIALYKANFFESAVEGCAPLDVTFTDASVNIQDVVQWDWLIDGVLVQSNFTDAPFQHTFAQRGEYEVTLVIHTNIPGCPGDTSAVHLIEVGRQFDVTQVLPQLECEDQTICPGDPVVITLINPGEIIIDGSIIEIDSMFVENNNTLVIIDNGCITEFDLESIDLPCNITFLTAPKAHILGYENDCETPYEVTLSETSTDATSILWNFGDGTTSTSSTVTHTYDYTGDFYVTLTAYNPALECPPSTESIRVQIRDANVELELVNVSCSLDSVLVEFDASASTDVRTTCSTGYTWDFLHDDYPPFRSDEDIIHEWIAPGTFDVLQLVGTDINGCTDTTSIPVAIYGANMDIGIDDHRICNDQEVAFTNLSQVDTTVVSLEWSFGDGSTSTDNDPVHTYTDFPNSDNEYPISLIISDALGCTYIIEDTIEYYNFYTPIIADATACIGQPFTITANDFTLEGSHLVYDWDFGNGTTGTGQTNEVIYTTLGEHTITLNYHEESSGCSRTSATTINVVPFPEASFESDNDSTDVLCYPANVFFTNMSSSTTPVTYFWDFGNGETSELENPATVFDEGEYTVTLYVTNELGCQDSMSRIYTVLNPRGDFIVDRTTICKGEAITFELLDTSDVSTFTWDFGDGVTVSDVNPISHNYTFHPPNGTTVASLILYSEGGLCPFSADTIINIQEVIADFIRNDGVDTALCFAPYAFTNLSENADTYLWDFGDGNTTTDINPVHQYSEPGTYEVSLYITNAELGCNDTITYPIILHPNPDTRINGDTICLGEEIEIEPLFFDPNSFYEWSPQEVINEETESSILTSPTESTTYYLSEETEFGCTGQDSAFVLVAQPTTYPGLDTTIVIGDSITLPVEYQDYYIFEWTPEEGLSCTDCSFPTVGPLLEEALYELHITDLYACFDQTLIFNITLHEESFIAMPTTFTPNGDGNNDEIPVFGWGIQELLEYQIFNRWGEKIFETSDMEEGWDGTFKGVPQNSDVYAYKIRATNWQGEEMIKEGFINLVR